MSFGADVVTSSAEWSRKTISSVDGASATTWIYDGRWIEDVRDGAHTNFAISDFSFCNLAAQARPHMLSYMLPLRTARQSQDQTHLMDKNV